MSYALTSVFALLGVASFHPWPARTELECRVHPMPFDSAVVAADAIFSGKVLSVEMRRERFTYRVARLSVEEVWKGDLDDDRVEVWSMVGSLGYVFREASEYLVYAAEAQGRLSTSICWRTAPLPDAQEDVRKLRAEAQVSAALPKDKLGGFPDR